MSSPSRIHEKSINFVINNVNHLKSLRSRPVIVGDLPWQIEITHRDHSCKIGGENSLAIHLHSLNVASINWSCAAMATIELSTFDMNREPLINVIGPWTFNRRELSWSRNTFIRWTELLDQNAGYVRNGRIRFIIKISAQKLPSPKRLYYQHILNVLQINFRIENVRNLLAADSNHFIFSDLQWKVLVRKNRFNDESYLGIILYCMPTDDNTVHHWTCNIFAEFQLHSERNPFSGDQFNGVKKFTNTNRCHGISKFINWCDLMNPQNGYVQNNYIRLTVNIRDDSRTVDGNNNNRINNPMAIRNYPVRIIWSESVDDDNENANTKKLSTTTATTTTTNSTNDQSMTMPCSICLESMFGREILNTSCGHVFCKDCILTSIKTRLRCPNCQAHLDSGKLHPLYLPL